MVVYEGVVMCESVGVQYVWECIPLILMLISIVLLMSRFYTVEPLVTFVRPSTDCYVTGLTGRCVRADPCDFFLL